MRIISAWFGLLLIAAVGAGGLALAQFDPSSPNNPSTFSALIVFLVSSPFSVMVVYNAWRRGIDWKLLLESKTVGAALSGLATAAALFYQHQINGITFAFAVYVTLVTIFLREAQGSRP